MRRHSIWYSPREDHEPSFEKVPPIWEEFRPLVWSLMAIIWSGTSYAAWHTSIWIGTTVRTVERLEQAREARIEAFRNK